MMQFESSLCAETNRASRPRPLDPALVAQSFGARGLGLSSLLEARDRLTRSHSDGVGRLLGAMLRTKGVGVQEIKRGELGGKLHDIGKLALRVELLEKKGRLSAAERARLKYHPQIGAQIVRVLAGDDRLVEVALYHHERFDGLGYPAGLSRLDIPILARMTAVADTFHALTENRPYRKGVPPERALAIVSRVKGSQLCPECVELLIETATSEPDLIGLSATDRTS